jgi:chemotaxis protein MotB
MNRLNGKSWATARYQKMISASVDSADGDHIWLITLSDILSLLLVFFIIFFAMSRVSVPKNPPAQEKRTSAGPAVAPKAVPTQREDGKLDKVRKDMLATVTALKMNDQVKIETTEREVIVTLQENVTFNTGEAEILRGSQPVLAALAETVKKNPSFLVDIDGHTDDQPIRTIRFPSNWELSVARATSVLKYLITTHELNPARFTIKGNADQRPLVPNWSAENRAQNRRVEIRLKEGNPAGA